MGRLMWAVAVATVCLSAAAGGNPKEGARERFTAQLKAKLSQIAANSLGVWEQENSTPAKEPNVPGYKLVRPSGEVEFVDALPLSGDGIAKLYVRKNPPGFTLVITDQGRQFVWSRLYWHPDRKRWLPSHPYYSTFQVEQRLVNDFLRLVTAQFDQNASYRIPVVLRQIRVSRDEEKRRKYIAELQELTRKVGGSWGGAALLERVYAMDVRIAKVPIEEKVAIAGQRRALLKQLAEKAVAGVR